MARDIYGIIKGKYPITAYIRRDIYNTRALLYCEKLGGLNPIAALIKLFNKRSISYIIK